MKTATIPSLRVDPLLREAAESVLESGEKRQTQREFIARGLASYERACRTGVFIPADEVMKKLEARLAAAKAKAKARK